MTQVYKTYFFRNEIDIPTVLGGGAPLSRKHFQRKFATPIIVERVVTWPRLSSTLRITGLALLHLGIAEHRRPSLPSSTCVESSPWYWRHPAWYTGSTPDYATLKPLVGVLVL